MIRYMYRVCAQAQVEANAMQEADTVGVPVQTSKRQKLNIVGIGKVRHLIISDPFAVQSTCTG